MSRYTESAANQQLADAAAQQVRRSATSSRAPRRPTAIGWFWLGYAAIMLSFLFVGLWWSLVP